MLLRKLISLFDFNNKSEADKRAEINSYPLYSFGDPKQIRTQDHILTFPLTFTNLDKVISSFSI